MDVIDVGTGRLSWRRLANLIRRLPASSHLAKVQHGPKVEWGPSEHFLAMTVDLLALANWQRGGDKDAPKPKPIPRPGGPSRDDLARRLLEQRERLRRR